MVLDKNIESMILIIILFRITGKQVIVTRVFIKVIEYYEHSFLSRLVGDYDAFNIFGFYIISITIQ